MSELFEPVSIGKLGLANRFVRSATFEGLASEQGEVRPGLIRKMVELAEGEVGLIVSGHAFVSREGRAGPRQLGAYDRSLLPGLNEMALAVRQSGGKMLLQLAHAGARGNSALSGLEAVGPSVLEVEGKKLCRAATLEDLRAITGAFGRAAALAKHAGFDGVQVHCAHGYLLSQFLSPYFNRREDAYGGSLENRARLALEVLAEVRAAVGPDYPLLVKLNSEDFLPGGLSREDSLAAAALLAEASADAIELSGGVTGFPFGVMPARPGKLKTPKDEGYYRESARLFKERLKLPLILVGGLRSLEVAEELLASGCTDFISLCRPLICEPALIKRWREGDRRKSECVSDNACYGPAFDGRGVFCVTLQKRRDKLK